MYELSGVISNIAISYATGKPLLTLEVNEDKCTLQNMYEELKTAEKLTIKIGKFKKKRSLDSNAYFWILVDKLSQRLNIPKDEIYRNAIRNIGGVSEIVCVKNEAVERLCQGWQRTGLGWQTETMPSKLEGCTNVVLYYGSSSYSQSQMTMLIENIVQDCKAVGIETLTPLELSRLLEGWK